MLGNDKEAYHMLVYNRKKSNGKERFVCEEAECKSILYCLENHNSGRFENWRIYSVLQLQNLRRAPLLHARLGVYNFVSQSHLVWVYSKFRALPLKAQNGRNLPWRDLCYVTRKRRLGNDDNVFCFPLLGLYLKAMITFRFGTWQEMVVT
jgi:hypothetical protein